MHTQPQSAPPPATLEEEILKIWAPAAWKETNLVLAVSGGRDSVALLRAMVNLKVRIKGSGRMLVAHFNHGWRPNEADEDAKWVGELCHRLGVPYEVGEAEDAPSGRRDEDSARTARYTFLTAVAERFGSRYVVTAHTADDQVETVLQRIVRGTGVGGLGGMRFSRPLSPSVALVRPFLGISRGCISDYLGALGQPYRSDSTNADNRFTRNRLRNDLLPKLREEYNQDVDSAILRLAAQATEIQDRLFQAASELVERGTSSPGSDPRGDVAFDCRAAIDQAPIIVREALKILWERQSWAVGSMGLEEWEKLARLAIRGEQAPFMTFPGGITAERIRDHLVLRRAVQSNG